MLTEIMTVRQVSAYVGLSIRSLERLSTVGEGPPRLRLSRRRVAYRKSDIDSWLTSRSTAKTATKAA